MRTVRTYSLRTGETTLMLPGDHRLLAILPPVAYESSESVRVAISEGRPGPVMRRFLVIADGNSYDDDRFKRYVGSVVIDMGIRHVFYEEP